ncbi:MAG: ABC transporter ATP-binding protein [bacterium]
MNTETAIEVKGVYKRFPKFKRYREMLVHPFRKEYVQVLKGVSLSVNKGELFGLLGPNGAGKTTLIKALCTLIIPEKGAITINGFDTMKEDNQVRSQLGYVSSEERSFYWRLTGAQNLEFFASLYNMFGQEARDRVDFMLELLELTQVREKMFKDYSTGMRQKLSIARGMINLPRILFLDEPTRSLDPVVAENLRSFIKEKLIKDLGTTVFLSSHNIMDLSICDRVALIHEGEIKACGQLEKLEQAQDRFVLKLKVPCPGLVNKLNTHPAVARIISPGENREPLEIQMELAEAQGFDPVAFAVQQGGKIASFGPVQMSLVEVFNRYFEKAKD